MQENIQSEIIKARSYYYEFFSVLFFFINKEKFNDWKNQLEFLSQNPLSDENENDFLVLKGFDYEKFSKEQNAVLYDFSYINVPLSASFYHEGRDEGETKVKVIDILLKSDFRKDVNFCKDSEDFIGFIFAMNSVFLQKNLTNMAYELFDKVINNFIDEFCEMLISHEKSIFFKSLGNILKVFVNFERAILGLNMPIIKHSVAKEAINKVPHQTKLATPKSKIHWDEFTVI